jgi:hypothetical protein
MAEDETMPRIWQSIDAAGYKVQRIIEGCEDILSRVAGWLCIRNGHVTGIVPLIAHIHHGEQIDGDVRSAERKYPAEVPFCLGNF